MATSERLTDLKKRIEEYEQTIASFEGMNGNLRMRRVGASDSIKDFCDLHITQNSRTIAALQHGLAHFRRQLNTESRDPFGKPN